MKITIERLKEIIKEEISGIDTNDADTSGLGGFTKGATQVTKTQVGKKAVQDALNLLAANLKDEKSLEKKAKNIGLIMQQLGISPDDLFKIANILRTKD